MNINITDILIKAPAKISYYGELENKFYAIMLHKHEEYKRLKAKKYLEVRSRESTTIKDIEQALEIDPELTKIKDEELVAEIEYRGWRLKKEKARDFFDMARELGWNKRIEMKSLNDTIKEG